MAAYHRKYWRSVDGSVRVGGDEGIRTHGSVDYMSIMRRHSHGCHRMHNHLAVRLMSFVLQHRPYKRHGQQPMDFLREFEYDGETYALEFDRGGYIYELEKPITVNVLPGRIRGRVKEPITHLLPKYDKDVGAYIMPDQTWVNVDRLGRITYRAKVIEIPDGGVMIDPFGAPPNPYGAGTIEEGTPIDPYIPIAKREPIDAGVAEPPPVPSTTPTPSPTPTTAPPSPAAPPSAPAQPAQPAQQQPAQARPINTNVAPVTPATIPP